MNKILVMLLAGLFLIACGKNEPTEKIKQSDVVLKRINDTQEVCDSMKQELDMMKNKIQSKEPIYSVEARAYRDKLPDIYLTRGAEYIKVCGVREN